MPPGGPQGAPVPSPLYPWMRSQFGEFADGESAVEGGEYELNMSRALSLLSTSKCDSLAKTHRTQVLVKCMFVGEGLLLLLISP